MGCGLGVGPWGCVGGAQGHNERIVAGVSPGARRSKKRLGFQLSCSALDTARALGLGRCILRMLQRLRLLV